MAGNLLNDPNFAANTAATVERVVGNVRRKAVQPLVYAARATVFGVLGAFLAVIAVVLLLVALTRGLQALLDTFVTQPRAVYISYLIVGGLLSLIGLVLMSKRSSKSTTTDR